MACFNSGCLCNRLIFSQSVTFDEANDTLLINIPQAAYNNGQRYCLAIGQTIPPETTIAATAAITIGDDDTIEYPLVNPNCTNVNASQLRTRAIYPTRVFTNIQDGVFKLMDNLSCNCNCNNNVAPSLPIPTVVTQNTSEEDGAKNDNKTEVGN